MWPQQRAGEVLRTFADLARTAPEELSLWAWLLNFPPVDQIPEPVRGQSFVAIDFTFLGSAEAAEELVAPLRAVGTTVLDTTGTVPVDRIGTVAMEPDDPTPAVEGSTLLHTFDDHTIWSLLAVTGPETHSPLLAVEIRHLGGALARPAQNPGVQSVVDGEVLVFYLGIPMVPGIQPQIHERMAVPDTALAPFSTGRRFFNFTPGAGPVVGYRAGAADQAA